MRIAVIGAGAMGSIYGGHLSLHNDVYLVVRSTELIICIIPRLSPPQRASSPWI